MKKLVLSVAMIAFGTFAMAQQNKMMHKMDPAQMEQKRAEKLKMMQTELNLSDAQVAKIKTLQDSKMAERSANAPKMQAERKAKMEKMKVKREEWKSEMKLILTPDQYMKWEKKNAEKMQKRGDKMMKKSNKMHSKSMKNSMN